MLIQVNNSLCVRPVMMVSFKMLWIVFGSCYTLPTKLFSSYPDRHFKVTSLLEILITHMFFAVLSDPLWVKWSREGVRNEIFSKRGGYYYTESRLFLITERFSASLFPIPTSASSTLQYEASGPVFNYSPMTAFQLKPSPPAFTQNPPHVALCSSQLHLSSFSASFHPMSGFLSCLKPFIHHHQQPSPLPLYISYNFEVSDLDK